jgi:hypothetical protein
MKVEINENKLQGEVKYPCLMKGEQSGVIVLFSSLNEGTVLNLTEDYELGHHSENWMMDNFAPFSSSITLSND